MFSFCDLFKFKRDVFYNGKQPYKGWLLKSNHPDATHDISKAFGAPANKGTSYES